MKQHAFNLEIEVRNMDRNDSSYGEKVSRLGTVERWVATLDRELFKDGW
jgi:hypothetical protein